MDLAGSFSGYGLIALAFIVIGVILVIVEMSNPGIGAPGIIGGIMIVLGIIIFSKSVLEALIILIIVLAILGVSLIIILQSASKGKLSKHLVLTESLNDDIDIKDYVGKEGHAFTVLRPSGTAEFNGLKLDVVTDGEYIPKGSKVEVVKVEGNRIVVRRVVE